MTSKQLNKHLSILYKHLVLADNRMHIIANKLGIEQNTDLKALLAQVEELIKIGEEKCS